MRIRQVLVPIVMAAAALAGAPALAQEPVAYKLSIAPLADAQTQTIEKLVIAIELGAGDAPSGTALFRMSLVANNVDTMLTSIQALEASDALGKLELVARDTDGPNGAREWSTGRQTHGPVRVRYSVPANAVLPPRGPAPPINLTNDANAVSGGGSIFLLTPVDQTHKYRVEISWDLGALGANAKAFSSLGDARATRIDTLSVREIRSLFFMGGQIQTEPTVFPKTGLIGGWQGEPPFDGAALMKWGAELYADQSRFFGQKDAPSYSVFLRYNPINAGGGNAFYKSFVITYGKNKGKGNGTDAGELKSTLSHEMFHTFQPEIGPDGQWFNEGSAVFYQSRLPARSGLLTADQFLTNLNFHAARYYTSALGDLPNTAINPGFWKDTRIRTLPYDRGMLYLVTVDEAVRKASRSQKTLDDIVLELQALQRQKPDLTNDDWRLLMVETLGETGGKAFDAFLAGGRPVPSSDAFGACFRRIEVPLRQYEVGFEPAVLGEPKRIVRGLVAGSTAEAAGLRNGDEIVKPVPQDGIQGDQTRRLELLLRRDGKEFSIEYLPRGATVMAYQWERVKGVPDDRCKF